MNEVKKSIFKIIQSVCKYKHTPVEAELYNSKIKDRCFENTDKWSDSIVCSCKNCPFVS